jgi:hypothetical protein
MAKSTRDEVLADIAKAETERRRRKLEEDYKRWIAGAAAAQNAGDKAHYTSLAIETLSKLKKLK